MAFRKSLKLLLQTQSLLAYYTARASSPQIMNTAILRWTTMRRFATQNRRAVPSSLQSLHSAHQHQIHGSITSLRGGGSDDRNVVDVTTQVRSSSSNDTSTNYVTLAEPAPGSRKELLLLVS